MIQQLHIRNFKSIKEGSIDCRRINLLIGRPNVGKSNLLEALALYGLPFAKTGDVNPLTALTRVRKPSELFHFFETSQPIDIGLTLKDERRNPYALSVQSKHDSLEISLKRATDGANLWEMHMDTRLVLRHRSMLDAGHYPRPAFYRFVEQPTFVGDDEDSAVLHFPHGDNLGDVLIRNPVFREQIYDMVTPYDYQLLLDYDTRVLSLQRVQGMYSFKIGLHLVADTFKRMMFHLAALHSNRNSILLFEEPEAHTFPAYVTLLAEEMVDAASNQFFVATHSPHLISAVMGRAKPEDLNIVLATYDDHQTRFRSLSEAEVQELYDSGTALLSNIDNLEEGFSNRETAKP